MKKRTFFLFELLIALTLIGMLISFLFSFLVGGIRIEKKMAQVRQSVWERGKVQVRLADAFLGLQKASLYTEKGALLFSFDHGVDPEPSFSGVLFGKLYMEENCLLFSYGPSEDKKRKELLLQDVKDFSLQFLDTEWVSYWPKENSKIPLAIRLLIQQGGSPLQFGFPLPFSPLPPYGKEAK